MTDLEHPPAEIGRLDPATPAVRDPYTAGREMVVGGGQEVRRQLARYQDARQALLEFMTDHFRESEYKQGGYPLPGRMWDYYKVPGSDEYALTHDGAQKLAQIMAVFPGRTETVSSIEERDYCSVTIRVYLVNHAGEPRGGGEASANTAESGFARQRKKYGARFAARERDAPRDQEAPEISPPDFRAALNDVRSRAKKRAFVQAVMVASACREILQKIAIERKGQKTNDRPRQDPPPPPPVIVKPDERGKWRDMPAGAYRGRALVDVPIAELVKVLQTKDLSHWPGLEDDITQVLEDHRERNAAP